MLSQPARAVWIEIGRCKDRGCDGKKSQPARAVWIEMSVRDAMPDLMSSQPARAVWIEIVRSNYYQCKPHRHSLRGLCGLKLPGGPH